MNSAEETKRDVFSVDFVESLPRSLKHDLKMQALATVIAQEMLETNRNIKNVLIYSRIDELPESIIDILAFDMHIDWYDYSYPLEIKRELLKSSVKIHRKLGTKYAMETALNAVYPGSRIKEWFEYKGKANTFRVYINVADEYKPLEDKGRLLRVINTYKRLSAHLDGLYYMLDYIAEQKVGYHTGMKMSGIFYPRYNVPYLYYDGTALYDGTYYYNQYRIGNVIDLYPAALSVQGDYQVQMRIECCKAGFDGILAKMPVTYQQDRITYTTKNNPSIQLDHCHLAIRAKTTGKVKHRLHRIKVKGMNARLRVVSRIPKIAYVSDIRSTPLIKDSRIMAHTDMMLNVPKYRVQLTIGYHLTKYDGTYCYDGSRKYDSKVIVDTL